MDKVFYHSPISKTAIHSRKNSCSSRKSFSPGNRSFTNFLYSASPKKLQISEDLKDFVIEKLQRDVEDLKCNNENVYVVQSQLDQRRSDVRIMESIQLENKSAHDNLIETNQKKIASSKTELQKLKQQRSDFDHEHFYTSRNFTELADLLKECEDRNYVVKNQISDSENLIGDLQEQIRYRKRQLSKLKSDFDYKIVRDKIDEIRYRAKQNWSSYDIREIFEEHDKYMFREKCLSELSQKATKKRLKNDNVIMENIKTDFELNAVSGTQCGFHKIKDIGTGELEDLRAELRDKKAILEEKNKQVERLFRETAIIKKSLINKQKLKKWYTKELSDVKIQLGQNNQYNQNLQQKNSGLSSQINMEKDGEIVSQYTNGSTFQQSPEQKRSPLIETRLRRSYSMGGFDNEKKQLSNKLLSVACFVERSVANK